VQYMEGDVIQGDVMQGEASSSACTPASRGRSIPAEALGAGELRGLGRRKGSPVHGGVRGPDLDRPRTRGWCASALPWGLR